MNYSYPGGYIQRLVRCNDGIRPYDSILSKKEESIIKRVFTANGVSCEIVEVINAANVIMYEIDVYNYNTKYETLANLSKTLSMRLQKKGVDIAPSSKCSGVSITIPKTERHPVGFGYCYMQDGPYICHNNLDFILGVDNKNEVVKGNLVDMAHLLIAGGTNSGKSTCLHSIIASILCHADPNSVNFIMIDPKQVELTRYETLNEVFMAMPPIYNAYKAIDILYNLVENIARVYKTLREAGCSNVEEYNKKNKVGLSYCVVVIDELSELMITSKKEFETLLTKISQTGRAAGVHIIAATQRPDAKTVTGIIKANLPARICFKVSSGTNSRIILDQNGGEKLLGDGDGLLLDSEGFDPVRFQGCFISSEGTKNIVDFINNQYAD